MKNITLIFSLFILTPHAIAQVGIGNTAPRGALEVTSSDTGFIAPQASLTDTGTALPVINPQGGALAAGTIVYNTNTANDVTPGYYYWDGSIWVRMAAATATPNNSWEITGNNNTTSGTHFLGTTNAQALDFRTNNTLRFRVANANQVHAMANGTDAAPFYSWSTDTDTGIWRAGDDQLAFSTNGTQRTRIHNNGSFTFNSTNYLQDFYRFECAVTTTSGDAMAVHNTGGNGVNQWTLNAYNSTADGGVIYGFASNTSNDNMAVNGVNAGATGLGVRGFTSSTSTNTAIGVQGTSNNSNHYAVYGNIPTTGLWTGFGGLFTGGLGFTDGIYNLSDKSFKKNIRKIDNALDMVLQMEGKKYEMNSPYPNLTFKKGDSYGFIAQELELILPEAVALKTLPAEMINTEKESRITNTIDAKMVDYVIVVPILVEAIKEQQEMIKKLEQRIEELEKK